MYQVNEIFTSLQGEGARAGTVNTFVRFSGCNLRCRSDGPEGFDCDTEFTSGVRLSSSGLVARARESWDKETNSARENQWVILTGGEPALQVDASLVDMFHEDGFFVAIETNGTQALPPNLDWVSCSPKTADHTIRVERANEVRVVRHAGQGVPKTSVRADHYFLSPAFGPADRPEPGALATCVSLCKENPRWRLSVQQHKLWGER